MKTALVIGATGLIGKHLTSQLLNHKAYSKVKVLVRKPLDIQHLKLEQLITDFDKLDKSEIVADDVFCCLGTTMKQAGSKEAFYKVDFTYPYEIAKIALANGAKQYAIVTAMGSNAKSLFFYNRVKGEIETALTNLKYPTLLIFRPSLLLGDRENTRFGEKLGEIIMSIFGFLIPNKYKGIKGATVANAMLSIAQKGIKGKEIYSSETLQKYQS